MDARTWSVVRRILEDARELPADERAAFVQQQCAGDETVRREVERLLAEGETDDAFLRSPTGGRVTAALRPHIPEGGRLGRYRVLRVLASGGMGTVYEAEQDEPRRRVALKVMHAGLGSEAARSRFRNEAHLLARLQHPDVAAVHEAGLPEEGGLELPWFAMELVEDARTIVAFARERGLPVRERLELFARACEAVHHGHQNGVIHRDIKPGNLLVDGGGALKVIDFGVARATDADVATTRHTQAGEVVGTLQYMSPEQLEADPDAADIRADVYALGVVLYELLCDRPPYDLEGKPLAEIARVVRDVVPPAPSRVVPALPQELDWIALRAMEKERDLRYASASELAADVRRQLADEPVLAGPPSAAYRMRKFVRRHKLGVAAAAAILLLLVAAVVGTTLGLLEASDQRDIALREKTEAEAQATKANTVVTFMIDLFETPDPTVYGPDAKVVDALANAEQRAAAAFEKNPEVEELLRYSLGKLYSNIGQVDDAEAHLLAAVALREREYGAEDLRTLQARMALGVHWALAGRLEEAEPVLTDVHAALRVVAGEDASDTIACVGSLAMLRHRQGDFGAAESLYREALDGQRRVQGEDHEFTLQTWANLGSLLQEMGRLDEADEVLVPCAARMTEVLGEDHPRTLNTVANLATMRIQQRRLDEAADLMQRALDGRRRILRPEHPHLLGSVTNLASLRFVNGDLIEARDLFEEVLALREGNYPPDSPDTVLVLCNLATVQHHMQVGGMQPDAAGLQQTVGTLVALDLGATADNLRVVGVVDRLAQSMIGWGRTDEAEALLGAVLAAQQRLLPEDSPETAQTRARLEAISPR